MKKANPFIFATFIFVLINCCFNIVAQPIDLIGSYYDQTGNLKHSIQKDYFITDCQLWKYSDIIGFDNKSTFQIENKGIHRQLELTKVDSLHYYFNDNGYQVNCVKKRSLAQIKSQNTPLSMDTGQVIFAGYIANSKKYFDTDSRVEFIFSDYVIRNTKSFFADIDSLGKFSMPIKIIHATSLLVKYRNKLFEVFTSSNDTLFLIMDADSLDNIDFMGVYADVNYDIQNIRKEESSVEAPIQYNASFSKIPAEFKVYRKIIRQKKHALLENYCNQYNCSDAFKTWYREDCDNNYYIDLMGYSWRRFDKDSDKRLSINDDYYSFIDSLDLNDSIAPISYSYLFFAMTLFEKLNQKDDIYNLDFYKTLESTQKKQNPAISDAKLQSEIQKAFFEYSISIIKNGKYSKFRDLRLAISFSSVIENRENELIDYAFSMVRNEIKYKPYLDILTSYYNDFKTREERFKNEPIVVNKSPNKGDLLLKELINKNKNKIMIIDFWFTGCSACRSDFQKMPAIKNKMLDKDIAFIYLCYASTESSWKNVIKEFDIKGEHYLLTNDQISYFKEKYSFNAAPTYFLINKAGRVINTSFRPTMNPDQYIAELEQNLQK